MDSLVANYGSDDEDGDSPPVSPRPAIAKTSSTPAPTWNRQSLLRSLPPPKSSAPESSSLWDNEYEPVKPLAKRSARDAGDHPDQREPATSFFSTLLPPKRIELDSSLWDDVDESLKRPKRMAEREGDSDETAPAKSLFTSLLPPKIESVSGEPLKVSARNPELEPVDEDTAAKRQTGFLSSSLVPPSFDLATLPSGFFDSPSSVAQDKPFQEDNIAEVKPSSLFARLPPPASSKPLFAKLPPPSTAKPKQVVEFKPPINYALLEPTDEDDDFERSKKRAKILEDNETAANPKSGLGLMAFLPPPKNSLGVGAALGGGNSHGGRRTVMETAAGPYRMAKEATSTSGSISTKAEKSEVNVERPATRSSGYGYGIEPAVQPSEGSYAQPDSNLAQPVYGPSHFGNGGYSVGNGYDEQSWQYPEPNSYGASNLPVHGQGNAPVQVLAEVMKKERRKGREEPPPQMIEVKQADLTGGSKLREDQMRSTGIAFGPSYKPAASNKDKPSKIHRRKHQIGALYFDMKQNEMNLLDRRAKGNLTKAETQAKYGW